MSPRIRTEADVERYLTGLAGSTVASLRGVRGPDRARALFALLGDPQDRYRTVHVAGTAGKGSVVTFVAAILHAHGFTVGAHLSPHVHSVRERFQLDGRPAAVAAVAAALDGVTGAVDALAASGTGRPSYFEVTNAVAFRLFAARPVDYAVVETGIGGLLDSTNTVSRPDKLAVITPISYDHTNVLGETLAEIARQKAGILVAGGQAVVHRSGVPEADRTIAAEAARVRCRLDWFDPTTALAAQHHAGGGRWHATHRGAGEPVRLRPGPPGRHLHNAALAVTAAGVLARRDGWRLDPRVTARALATVTLPGRFERCTWRGREVVLDGAHNTAKLAALAATVADRYPGRRAVWVLAMRGDKDLAALETLAPAPAAVVATEFVTTTGDRPASVSVPAEVLAKAARVQGVRLVVAEPGPAAALRLACDLAAAGDPVVVSGSFHLVAAVGALAELDGRVRGVVSSVHDGSGGSRCESGAVPPLSPGSAPPPDGHRGRSAGRPGASPGSGSQDTSCRRRFLSEGADPRGGE